MNDHLIIPGKLGAWARKNARIGRLMGSEYGASLAAAYDALDTSVLYESYIHGAGHIERTMLLGAMIAQSQELSMHETAMLLLCCSYHDIGRSNDLYDPEHGRVSAQMLGTPEHCGKLSGFGGQDIAVMRAAISLHSRRDKDIDLVAADYELPEDSMARYYRVARCLKDADNLDRVRLGDLDTKHLRHPDSVAMAADAQWIYDRYIG